MFRPAFSLMARVCAGVFFCFIALVSGSAHGQGTLDGNQEYRAFWIDAFNSSYKTPAEITSIVNAARAANLNAIILQVRKRGDAFYNSNFEPKALGVAADFDPLADLIAKAHDTNAGPRIEVHAWIVAYHIWNSTTAPSQINHPYNLHPDWLSKTESGETFDGNYTFDQGHPEVQEHTFNVAMDIISRYDVDGLNFDYIRYSSPSWGYNDVTVARFNEQFSRTGQPQAADAEWKQFRRDQITGLMRKIYLHTLATKPQVKISVDAITFAPGITSLASWYNSSAWTSVLQDWRGWMEEGMIDLAIPMAYFRHHEPVRALDYQRWSDFTKDHQYNRHAIIGPGIYLNHATNALLQMRMSRDPSTNGNYVKGVAGYSWAVPTEGDVSRSTFFSALTQPGITYPNGTPLDPNPTPLFAQPATIPPMPWKLTPTNGHIKGFVFGGAQIFDGAVVTLTGGAIHKAMTNDATGFYGYVEVPPGTYTLKATAPGYGIMQTNVMVSAGIVTTANLNLRQPDNVTPKLWDVKVEQAAFSATVTWRTDERSDSTVEFGFTSTFGNEVLDPTLVKTHSVTLTNLEQRTGYFFRVRSKDAAGNETVSDTYSFLTYHEGFVPDIIIDNPEAKVTGSWSSGTFATDKYGDNYRFKSAGSGAASLEYRPNIITNGTYAVYAWYPQGPNRAIDAPYVITFDGGVATVRVNQQTNGGQWNLLGEFNFQAGTSGFVKITDAFTSNGGLQLMADAVKFASVPPPIDLIVDNSQALLEGDWNTSNSGNKIGSDYNYVPSVSVGNATHTATYAPAIAVPGKYNVYAYFPGNATRSSKVPLVISYNGGTFVTNLNQTSSVGGWRKVASELDFALGTSGYVRIANDTGENVIINKTVVADAFRFSLAEPPSIILNPGNQVVTNGGTANFSVGVFGSGPLQYQWKYNGTNVTGGTNSTLTLPDLTLLDGGEITVDVSNDKGSITSLPASLLVTFAVHPQFGLISRLPDGRFQFEGSGDNGTYNIEVSTNLVQWTKVSEVVNTNGHFSFSDVLTNLPARYYRIRWEH